MRRALAALLLVMSTVGLFAPSPAAALVNRDLTVSGDGAGMYPAFNPTIARYAVTTTDATNGVLDVSATPGSGETVTINGGSDTHLTGLSSGDLITVVFVGSGGAQTYTLIYLPSGFPQLTATVNQPDKVQPGLVALTLNPFDASGRPSFGAIVDRNGVPVYAVNGPWDTDLKQQPNGDVTVSRVTHTPPGNTGYSLVTLDTSTPSLPEIEWRSVAGDLTDTDGHDSVRLPDGSTILIGYEPRGECTTGYLDATIQKQDAAGNVVFEWNSADHMDPLTETLNPLMWPTGSSCQRIDYAHVNSVVSVENDDVIVSFRHLSAVYRIATKAHDTYAEGQVIWRLGGRHSDFTFYDAALGTEDPLGGPCAQHAASQLSNGHLLVFDNGTDGICVDPSDPTGAPVDRGFTRITEYALDVSTTPHTATVVWSYPSDQSRYALFAGNATRLPNGDTLIGWAADRSAVTTEVDDAGQKVWELTAPDPGGGLPPYATYRAALVGAPQLTMTGPADGSVVIQDASVPASATCTDWVSNALQSCVRTGLVGDALDTSTLGTHTWTVTGEGGAGVTSSQSRRYTVRPIGRQPDGLIRKHGSTWWKGANVYGPATDQTIRQHAHRRHTVTSFWRVQNDGERPDSFGLLGTGGTRRYKVHYFAGSIDVTRAVVAGTYRTTTLAPGASTTLRVEVKPTRRARVGKARTFTLRATSVATSTATDRVATRVTARR